MRAPKVSVVMPAHERAWIIERAVGSVLGQTMSDLELLVVDDGSTDGTPGLLERLPDPRLRLLRIEHAGPARARNVGLACATGELIAYLDTDNVWRPEFLEVMTAELTEHDVLAYCGLHRFLVEGDRGSYRIVGRKVDSRPFNPMAMLRGNVIDTNTAVHRRLVLDEIGGFDEGLGRLLDWDLFARIAMRYPFAVRHIDQVLVDYYYYPRAMTATITNAEMTDEQVAGLFGLGVGDEATCRVRGKLERLIHDRSYRAERHVVDVAPPPGRL